VNRARTTTLAFAITAAAVTVVTAFVAYRGMRSAFERESAQRLGQLAELAASQVSPDDLADARRAGPEGTGLLALQAQLDVLCAATGLANAAVLDADGRVLYDVRAGSVEPGAPSAYDSLAHSVLARARAGTGSALALPPFRRGARAVRAAVASVPGEPGTLLVTEAYPAWGGELARLRRDLATLAAVSVLAVALLAALAMRANAAQLTLERRLSRSENLASMGRMTATLAHEIKNPLAIIRGSARRLGKLDAEAQRMADSVVEEVDRLSTTVNRYLQFARGGPGGADGPGDAAASLGATLDLLEGECLAQGCALERTGEWPAAPVRLDDASLKQVWLNVVQNALEAAPQGGRVQVALSCDAGRVCVRVTDDGPGIAAAVLARLGEPFYTTRAQGTGLGLYLSRQLVQGAGGTLDLASREGAGTTVIIELPLAENTG
jgi:signal transduction histidine kinase